MKLSSETAKNGIFLYIVQIILEKVLIPDILRIFDLKTLSKYIDRFCANKSARIYRDTVEYQIA